MTKPKKSPVETAGEGFNQQNQQQQKQAYGTAQGTLDQFEGPVQQSGLYKSLLNTGTQATSDAYQNVVSSAKATANKAGFGEQQPVTQGAETEVRAREARDLGNLPAKTTAEVAPMELQAAGQTGHMGDVLGGEALGYETGVVTPLETQYQNQSFAANNALWQALLNTGGDVAGALVPGAGGGMKRAAGSLSGQSSGDEAAAAGYGGW